MEFVDRLRGLLTGRKSLAKVSTDDLRKERLRLEQTEQRIARELDQLEQQKRELFNRGKAETNQRQQIALARKIKELDTSAQARDRQLGMISRQTRVLSGLMTLKENEQLTQELGVSSIVSRMDLADLEKYVEKATVEGQFQMERFAEILQTLEGAEPLAGGEEDEDTLAIVAAMQEARDAETEQPEAADTTEDQADEVNRILHSKDEQDRSEDEAARP